MTSARCASWCSGATRPTGPRPRPSGRRPSATAVSSAHPLPALPAWEDGTVAVLSTGGGPPPALPGSTAVRAGRAAILLALALRRVSLARLRAEPAVALTVMAADVACTALGRATVVREPMAASDAVAAVLIDVEE